MTRVCTILVACILTAGLTACGESGALVAPEAPRYDGGFGGGSGGQTMSTDTTDTTTADPSSTETTTEDTTTERGTLGIGSGG